MTPPLRDFPIRRLAGAALLAGALVAGSAAGAEDATAVFRFDPAAHPAPPRLTIDRRPQVCASFLAKITAIYASEEPRLDFPTAPAGPDEESYGVADAWGFARVPWEDRAGEAGVERDFDGDGEAEVLALIEKPHGMFEKTGLFLFANREEMEAAGALDPFDAKLANGWTTPVLLENAGSFVVFYPWNDQFDLGLEPMRLLALTPEGELAPVCEIEIFPRLEGSPPRVPLPAHVKGEGFRRLTEAVGRSLGAPVRCLSSGASRGDYINRETAVSVMFSALYRPWVPLENPGIAYTVRDLDALAYLRDYWRFQDLWNYRVQREIEAALGPARQDLARRYAEMFGAADLPDAVVESRLRGLVSGFYGYVYSPGRKDPLAAALLTGDALTRIDGDLIVVGDQAYGPEDYRDKLTLALEHPALVDFLLDHGADAEAANDFGKTPLMHAAQFGLVESARRLLTHGADPNRRTTQKPDRTCNSFKWIDRTALMYAAESASPEMIALLIENGADVEARDVNAANFDKPDRGIADYLSRNGQLDAAQRQALIERWSIPTAFPE